MALYAEFHGLLGGEVAPTALNLKFLRSLHPRRCGFSFFDYRVKKSVEERIYVRIATK